MELLYQDSSTKVLNSTQKNIFCISFFLMIMTKGPLKKHMYCKSFKCTYVHYIKYEYECFFLYPPQSPICSSLFVYTLVTIILIYIQAGQS